uniref:Polycystin cation channel family n=1 Tax=Tetraselmis sp. GSL018 TaxID=582737 RepID=A0A061RIA9_9CHLO|mmetsp:Transcript_35414/g.83941  ORF Transcript_35414/g.83941 Transcript_35414/m.83941 type:complete len:1638 (-) Transcript_35414:258-5171(-)|eukprot:CAMPEP_0177601496 /NCGR_PEP_ID=MMETSP0419_2-20121207/14294_1 /TAXON_ID=582737 /ORGANISM="Tetraselmis sp., Strain GSL018" /LENGTH=1637 /DNA_ID=CAMNT_0019094773 /DNA_START=960 /DNA_END=5873 /DNA_ORIENTATION=-
MPRINQSAVVNTRVRDSNQNTEVDTERDKLIAEDFESLEEDERASRAATVVKELYKRYQKQTERWHNYVQLFSFLAFVAIFLSVLFLQRNAQVAYAVHSTVKDTLVPSSTTLSSSDEVLSWLQSTLAEVWKDPVCGDGVCETPFEFASYGRFGCRADCGRLSEVQNLTTIVIDLDYNFRHPVGSIPATELMQQARWNLCPRNGAPHGTDCYYSSDQQFSSVQGSTHVEINDVPDGEWVLVIKRDIFNKVAGAVRDKEMLEEEAHVRKISMAVQASRSAREFEIERLMAAADVTNRTVELSIKLYVDSRWSQFQADMQAANETGKFDLNGQYNETLAEEWIDAHHPFMVGAQKYCPADLVPTELESDYECRELAMGTTMWDRVLQDCEGIPGIDGQGGGQGEAPCGLYMNISISALEMNKQDLYAVLTSRRALVDQHLKEQVRSLRAELSSTQPEVVSSIDAMNGRDAENAPALASLSELAEFYLEPILTGEITPPAKAALTTTRLNQLESDWTTYAVQEANMKIVHTRIQNRIDEIKDYEDDVEARPEVRTMRSYFAEHGMGYREYNYVAWTGGAEAYLTTNLTLRAPGYVGQCRENVTVTQTTFSDKIFGESTSSETLQYTETSVPNLDGGSTPEYIDLAGCRALCYCPETPCDSQDASIVTGDSNAVGSTEFKATYCECEVCRTQLSRPVEDDGFQTIVQSIEAAGTAAGGVAQSRSRRSHRRRLLAGDPAALDAHRELLHLKHAARRRLLQTTDTADTQLLNQLISNVGDLSSQQSTLSSQVESLEQEVIAAAEAAETRAADNTLEELIQAGRQDIRDGQARVEGLLTQIIDKQNQAAEAAEQAAAALQQIQDLQTQMEKSQRLVEQGVQKQLEAIMVASQQQMITLSDALILWERARVDRLKYDKQVRLSNMQTSNYTAIAHPFVVSRYNSTEPDTARERNIGLTNRVIAGMLLHTTRTEPANCSSTRFDNIENTCSGPIDISQYGVDPVFKMGAEMYNSDLDNLVGITAFYDCEELGAVTVNGEPFEVTYDLDDPINPGAKINPKPFCAELFNERNIPWGFHHFALDDYEDGFPVWFDINLSEGMAQRYYTYLREGLFLDGNTRSVSAQIVTYNAELRVFSAAMLTFKYSDGGTIDVSHKLHTVRVELYSEDADIVRLCLEIFLTIATVGSLISELYEMVQVWRRTGSPMNYFQSAWNWIDLTSIALLVCTMCMWWIFVLRQASKFDIDLRYDVYESLTAPAAMLRLAGDGVEVPKGEGLRDVQASFAELQGIVDTLAWYYAINGINILFLIARVLKLMDFQPRLGVVTRSLALAGPDLAHFVLVSGMVFVGYAMMAHLIFGNNIEAFASFGRSVDTCFEILLGDVSVNAELRALSGLQGVAGTLFFWTFELLVFMVLLNFLLAIIVDAFSEVKENTTEHTGMHTDLGQMLSEKWRSVTACFGRSQHISDRRLGQLLKQWGGADEDEDEGGEEKEKHIRLLDTNLTAEDLKRVLGQCLANSNEGDFDTETGRRLFGGGGKAGLPTQEEISLAAEYVVTRFGTTEDEEEEEEEGEGGEEGEDGPGSAPVDGATGERLYAEKALEKERDALAQALDRLSDVQRQLAEGQQKLMSGQSQLKAQHERLLDLMSSSK